MKDMVNHPEHYISDKGIEVIDVIEAFTEGLEGIEATDTGNIIKYICRWKHKNGLQDLEKARWYLNHLIERVLSKEELSPIEEKPSLEEFEIYKDGILGMKIRGYVTYDDDHDGFLITTEKEEQFFFPTDQGYTYAILNKKENDKNE